MYSTHTYICGERAKDIRPGGSKNTSPLRICSCVAHSACVLNCFSSTLLLLRNLLPKSSESLMYVASTPIIFTQDSCSSCVVHGKCFFFGEIFKILSWLFQVFASQNPRNFHMKPCSVRVDSWIPWGQHWTSRTLCHSPHRCNYDSGAFMDQRYCHGEWMGLWGMCTQKCKQHLYHEREQRLKWFNGNLRGKHLLDSIQFLYDYFSR